MANVRILTGNEDLTLTVPVGQRLSDLLQECGHSPDMPCGGKGLCRKCRVLARGELSQPTAEERQALSPQELSQGIRLACCTQVLGDVEVRPGASRAVSQICTDGATRAFAPEPAFSTLGAAVDLGTTTLAAQLYAPSGNLLATAAAPNPQRSFGADVISRVGRAMAGDGPILAGCIRQAIRGLLRRMCEAAGRSCEEIDGLVLTGNTAMLHLLTGEDPSPLAAAPFAAKELFGHSLAARDLDLPCASEAEVYLPRCISAFVGADITTALLSSGICQSSDTALLADIGTNGEIALWHQGALLCCSTAAGPAFEGASLSCGMQGAAGAIDHAWVQDGALVLHTIGDAPAAGICGSGVADVLAGLLQLGQLDSTGLLQQGSAYPLTAQVSFTQKDVRQVQLAKGAIRAGMETLLSHAGLKPEEVSTLAIAGGFGSYLSLDSAAAIGLIPPVLAPQALALGNAALSGAAMVLCRRSFREECLGLARGAQTLELATDPVFQELYLQYMHF